MSKTLEQPAASSTAGSRFIIYGGVWFAVFNWGASFVAARFLLHPASAGLVVLSPSLLAATRFSLASLFFLVPLVQAMARRQISMRDILLMLLPGQLAFSLYFWMQYTGVQQTSASIASILVVGLILLTLLNPTQNRWQDIIQRNPTQWLALLFLALVCSVVSYFAYNTALSKLDASRVAVYIYFEPVVTVFLGVTLLHEQLTWQSVLGSLAIAGSIVLVNWLKRSRSADGENARR